MADSLPSRAALHRLLDELPDETMPAVFDAARVPLEQFGRSLPDRAAFTSMLDRLARKASPITELRTSTFSREMIYGDHD